MPEQALVQLEPAPVVRDPEAIVRYALDKGADVAVVERIMAIRRELMEENSKAAFDIALAAFQAECPVIKKDRGVPDRSGRTAYKYAPFEAIVAATADVRQRHGFSYELDTDVASEPGWVIAVCKVTHRAGHSRTSRAKFPLGGKTGIMSDTQVYASALTFASRRVFCNAFGIVPAGEDADGATDTTKPAGPSAIAPDRASLKQLAQDLWDTLKPVRGNEANWKQANQWLWDECLLGDMEEAPHLTVDRFKAVTQKAKEKLA